MIEVGFTQLSTLEEPSVILPSIAAWRNLPLIFLRAQQKRGSPISWNNVALTSAGAIV
jgi:hypothetical protein